MFSLGIFFFSCKIKQNKSKKKKNHGGEKKCREGRVLSFKLPFCLLSFGSHFYPATSALLFQRLSLGIFFFSSRRKRNKTKKKKTIKKKKMQRKEGVFLQAPTLPSHFWVLLLPSHFYPFVLNAFS
jgi:hypothetical protein